MLSIYTRKSHAFVTDADRLAYHIFTEATHSKWPSGTDAARLLQRTVSSLSFDT